MNGRRFALDTNVLVYAVDDLDPERQQRARLVIERSVRSKRCMLSVQVVGELYTALQRRRLVPPPAVIDTVRDMVALFPLVAVEAGDPRLALDAVGSGRLAYWDALMVTTVGRIGCTTLLSEDMQDGATLAGVTIRDPFRGDHLPGVIGELLG